MATKKAKKKRNRAAQDATLINVRALAKRVDKLAINVSALEERLTSLEDDVLAKK